MTLYEKLDKILIAGDSWKTILAGLLVTVQISFAALVLGTVLGAVVCLFRTRKNPIIRGIASGYIAILRGTPVLMLLLLLYYGVFAKAGLKPLTVAIITFALNVSAHVDEIRQSMGMVFQKFHLFSEMDVMDNLCLAPVKLKGMSRKDAEEKAMELLPQVGLASRAHRWPEALSGGQKQIYRLQICSEELIYEMLGGCYEKSDEVDINIDISYSEANCTTELAITSGGKEFDPFGQEDDGLGVTILKKMAKSISCQREGDRNRIRIEL